MDGSPASADDAPPPSALFYPPVAGSNPLDAPFRLALYGGSFDPIHDGHLAVARRAREAFSLDEILFVPAARPPHKPGLELAPGADRLAMVQLAIEGEEGMSVSDQELRREGPSYTVQTLEELAAPDRELYLILGSDNLEGFPGWRESERLLALARPIVLWRAGDPDHVPTRVTEQLGEQAAEQLRAGFLALDPHPGRATDLRAAIRRGDPAVPHLDPRVQEYIRERGLYGA